MKAYSYYLKQFVRELVELGFDVDIDTGLISKTWTIPMHMFTLVIAFIEGARFGEDILYLAIKTNPNKYSYDITYRVIQLAAQALYNFSHEDYRRGLASRGVNQYPFSRYVRSEAELLNGLEVILRFLNHPLVLFLANRDRKKLLWDTLTDIRLGLDKEMFGLGTEVQCKVLNKSVAEDNASLDLELVSRFLKVSLQVNLHKQDKSLVERTNLMQVIPLNPVGSSDVGIPDILPTVSLNTLFGGTHTNHQRVQVVRHLCLSLASRVGKITRSSFLYNNPHFRLWIPGLACACSAPQIQLDRVANLLSDSEAFKSELVVKGPHAFILDKDLLSNYLLTDAESQGWLSFARNALEAGFN